MMQQTQPRNLLANCCLAALCLSFPALVAAQDPIKLLKDLQPGHVPGDRRNIYQVKATTDTLYYISSRETGYFNDDTTFYLNWNTGHESSHQVGHALGPVSLFGTADRAPHDYPFFALRDGKAILCSQNFSNCMIELDGATGTIRQLTWESWPEISVATWAAADGNVYVLRRNIERSGVEIARLDENEPYGIQRTATIVPPLPGNYSGTGPARVLNGVLLFTVFENDNKTVTLWRSDGTAEGTFPLHTEAGTLSLKVTMINALDQCFFNLRRDNFSSSLFITDATVTGTRVIDSTLAGYLPDEYPFETAQSSSTLYWLAPYTDKRVNYSDGITTGALPKGDFWPYNIGALAWANDNLYISYYSVTLHLMESDGRSTPTQLEDGPISSIHKALKTEHGTYVDGSTGIWLVTDDLESATPIAYGSGHNLGSSIPNMAWFKGAIAYDNRWAATNSDQLWLSDPLNPGDRFPLSRFTQTPASSDPGDFLQAGPYTYFRNTKHEAAPPSEVYRSDGTAASTIQLSANDPVWLGSTPNGAIFYHRNRDAADAGYFGDSRVYVTDGSTNPPGVLTAASDTLPSELPTKMFSVNGKCLFAGASQSGKTLLHVTDGTPGGTRILMEHDLQFTLTPMGVAGNLGFYYGSRNDTPLVTELWCTDGTEEGTVMITNTLRPSQNAATVAGGKLVFSAQVHPTSGYQLFVSDGTAAGTIPIGPVQDNLYPVRFISAGGRAFYLAYIPDGTTTLMYTDGTSSGTTASGVLFDNWDEDHLQMKASVHGGIYFAISDDDGVELFYTNGPPSTTVSSGRIEGASRFKMLAEADGIMYFAMATPALGRELYKTGPVPDPVLIQDLAPGHLSGAIMEDAAVVGTKLIFAANPQNGLTGRELFYLDLLPSNINDWQLY